MVVVSELTLPVRRIPVQLLLADGTSRDAALFASAGEDVGDLLEGGAAFLPVDEDGRIRLVARAALACVAVAWQPAIDPPDDEPRPYGCRVRVHLLNSETVEGDLRYLARPERSRTADYLNEDARYIAVRGRDHLYHVNKAHIASVEELTRW